MPIAPADPSDVPKPSLLVVSHTYVVEENRKKIIALARHFRVTCAAPAEIKTTLGKIVQKPTAADPRYVAYFLQTIGNPNTGTRYLLRGLAAILRENHFDIVVAEAEPWSFLRWQVWLLKRYFQPKALFGEFTWENIERLGFKGKILGTIYRMAARTQDFVVAGNREAGSILEKHGSHASRVLVAPQLGVDEHLFRPLHPSEKVAQRLQLGLPGEVPLVGYCGRFDRSKGLLDLVAGIEIARKQQPRDIHLVLLGKGPLQAELEQLATQHPWLHLLPPRKHHEIPAFLGMLDLFALPSQSIEEGPHVWKEQFGHVIIEAAACRIPVVGSNTGAIPDLLLDSAFIFDERSPTSLAASVCTLLSGDSMTVRAADQSKRLLGLYTNDQLATTWGDFMHSMLRDSSNTVLWIDPNMTMRSPSIRHLINSAPHLQTKGWRVKAWCQTNDHSLECEATVFVGASMPWPLSSWLFTLQTTAACLWHRVLMGRSAAPIIHTMGGQCLGANVVSVHFLNSLWFKMHWRLGFEGLRDFASWLLTGAGVIQDALQLWNPTVCIFLPVSQSIAGNLSDSLRTGAKVEVLPNTYDAQRFNAQARAIMRGPMREQMGYNAANTVFAFVSQGHYRRKGFWLAVEALSILRARRPGVRLLVVGGAPEALANLKARLEKAYPGWSEWVHFAGLQPEVERYLSAADGLLFPSYFEAFSLVEIEASALGVPLFLTPHFGSEMILREGVNGHFIPFDAKGIADCLQKFIVNPLPSHATPGLALEAPAYAERLHSIYCSVATL